VAGSPPRFPRESTNVVTASASDTHYRRELLAAIALYLLIAGVLLGRGLLGCSDCYVGRGSDPPQFMWCLRWWHYAIAHRLNPFWTDLIWAPRGFNLAWVTIVPLPACVSIPLQMLFGERTAYNVLAISALAAAAASAYALCHRITHAFWPSIVGGAMFGFSPYMLGQALGHLQMIQVFAVPLAILVALKRLDGELSLRRYVAAVAGLLIAQFLCSIEIFATLTVVAGIAIVLALVCLPGDKRANLARLIPPTALAYLVTVAVVSPYLYALLASGVPHGPIWTPDRYAADVVNFVVPTRLTWLGTFAPAVAIVRRFRGTVMENGAYLGIVLIVIIEAFRRRAWHTPVGKFLVLLLLAIAVMAMGPTMHVAGHQTFVLPWAIFARLPIISSALPVRFMMYAFLVAGVITALWLESSPATRVTKYAAVAALTISMLPNPHAAFWLSRLEVPAFFSAGDYRTRLEPHEIVLVLPFGERGNSPMYWQARSGMYFRIAGGGVAPFEFERMPATNLFYGANDLPEATDQVKAYLARFEVRTILVDPSDYRFTVWQPVLDSLGLAHSEDGGLWMYQVPPGAFVDYRGLGGAYLERRATTRRFDAILSAVAAYLAAGHAPAKLSPAALKQFGLLPREWTIDSAPDAFNDWSVARLENGDLAVALRASYQAAASLIERYYATAAEIRYPAPARWTVNSGPNPEVIKKLLIIFHPAGLLAAADHLKTSPPAELTTPFIQPKVAARR
jgi:hypothetical protein